MKNALVYSLGRPNRDPIKREFATSRDRDRFLLRMHQIYGEELYVEVQLYWPNKTARWVNVTEAQS